MFELVKVQHFALNLDIFVCYRTLLGQMYGLLGWQEQYLKYKQCVSLLDQTCIFLSINMQFWTGC